MPLSKHAEQRFYKLLDERTQFRLWLIDEWDKERKTFWCRFTGFFLFKDRKIEFIKKCLDKINENKG